MRNGAYAMNEHQGHRQRMRRRFLKHGLENFDDHTALELLLFYALPRMDTNALAHRLLDSFGTLDGVLDAAPEELMAVEGIGENAAALIRLIPAMAARYMESKSRIGSILATPEAAGAFVMPYFMGSREERILMVCMDAKLKALDCRVLATGDVTTANVSVRKIVEYAVKRNAPTVLMAHNHVGGFALPSQEDVESTLRLRALLRSVGITLLDHIVVADDDFVSMKDSGYLEENAENEK